MDPKVSAGRSLVSGDGGDLEVTAPSGVGERTSVTPSGELAPQGGKVGRYTVLERVGSGGMGVVYSAFDPELDRRVALKLMHEQTAMSLDSSDGRERLLREAKAMARLTHPNVITVHDVGTYEDRVFIAMEFVDGPTLRAWIEQGNHEWQEVVEVFVKAGRGLAAAHAAGLVHRDFKPDNVLIGRGGRVLVMDFGLARRASSHITESHPSLPPASIEASGIVLTRTGALVGTPAYMAPEQHRRQSPSPLVDQFSFCVALYEGLYGERPFRGNNVASLAMSVLEGKVSPPPKGTRVPPWLREVVLRGLALDPEDRFPSMDALLAELQRDPPEPRRPWLTALVAVTVAGAVVGTYLATRPDEVDPCAVAEEHLEGAWGPEQRDAIHRAFGATELPYADASAASTTHLVDAWAERWSQQWTELCRTAAPGPNDDPAELPSHVCLDVMRTDLAALTETLSQADATVVTSAVEVADALPDPESCANVELVLAISDRVPPSSSDARERLALLRQSLSQARVLLLTGQAAEAARRAEPMIESARVLQDPGLEAEAELVLARALDRQDEPTPADRRLRHAVIQAASGRRPRLEAEAWVELVRIVGERMGVHAEGQRLALAAEAAIIRAHEPPRLRVRLTTTRAALELEQGRYDEAREHLEAAIEDLLEQANASELALADAYQDLGSAHDGLGRYAEAREAYEEALARREQLLGAQHPLVGAALARLGGAMLGAGLVLQADATFVRARWLLDPEHITDIPGGLPPRTMPLWQRRELGAVLDRQGLLARDQEELDAAETHHRHALAVLEDALGPSHRDLAYPLTNLGVALIEQGRPRDGLTYLRRAHEILRTELDADHPDLATVNLDLGHALWASRDYAGARERYTEALSIWEETLPDDHNLLAYALTGIGRCDIALGSAAAAIEPLERALEIRVDGDGDPLNVAETGLALARALWITKTDETRALELARDARDRAGAVAPTDLEGLQRLLEGGSVPRLTDLLVPAGIGTTNRNTRGR